MGRHFVRNALAAVALSFAVVLAGCGGDTVIKEDGLPVVCVAKAQPGHCGGLIPKVYYDYRYNRCKTFYWSGCGGHVPYQTMEDCRKECESGGSLR